MNLLEIYSIRMDQNPLEFHSNLSSERNSLEVFFKINSNFTQSSLDIQVKNCFARFWSELRVKFKLILSEKINFTFTRTLSEKVTRRHRVKVYSKGSSENSF